MNATALLISEATFSSKYPTNSVVGMRVLLVNRRYECVSHSFNDGEIITVKGILATQRPTNPKNHHQILGVDGETNNYNVSGVDHILKTRRVRSKDAQ